MTPAAFVTRGRRRAIGSLALTAFGGGMAEALFLVVVTRTAFAITDGDDEVGIVAGRYLSVGSTLLLALLLVIVRVGLAIFAASIRPPSPRYVARVGSLPPKRDDSRAARAWGSSACDLIMSSHIRA